MRAHRFPILIGAVVAILVAASPVLAGRRDAPDDPKAAKQAIIETWHSMAALGDADEFGAHLDLFDDSRGLLETARVSYGNFPEQSMHVTYRVTDVRFTSPTHAVVTWDILAEGEQSILDRRGDAVFIDGRWKMTRQTICDQLILGGGICEPTNPQPPRTTVPLAPGQPCAEPYLPVFVQRGYPFNEPPPAVAAVDVTIPTLDMDVPPIANLQDYDGNGTRDHDNPSIRIPETTVRRPAGDITFARPGVYLEVVPAGNLDGNPGQEMWVFDLGGRDFTRPSSAAWVVPYDTPAGRHDPADVGIRVPAGLPRPIADFTGDGVDDVLDIQFAPAFALNGPTRLLSGAEILAVGVPGDARGVEPVATLPGAAQVLADFGGPKSAILTTAADPDFARGIVVRLFEGETTTAFTTRPSIFLLPGEGAVHAFSGPGGRFLNLSGTNRSGGIGYWWSVDNPCSPLSADGAGGPAGAVPAAPNVGTPRLTG
jgi:hypothetical protein